MAELKSPTCRECALKAGLVPVSSAVTMYRGECAHCRQIKMVSTISDWKRPNVITSDVDWD
jgi:hypothetical protein